MEQQSTLVLFVFLLTGVFVGAVGALIQGGRFRKMRNDLREYANTYGIVETNKRLIVENQTLHTELDLRRAEILRYRRALAAFAKRDKKRDEELQSLREEMEKQRKEVDALIKREEWRFGALMRILNKNNLNLPPEDLNTLTPG